MTTVHSYATFINFQDKGHNMILESKRDSAKQVHHVGFMFTDEDMDAIIHLWLEEWHGPLEETIPEGQDE